MTTIPGTSYKISGNDFVSPEGTKLTQQQFLEKVEKKEISLTENSLKFLEGNVGPDMLKSLRSGSGLPGSPSTVSENLSKTEKGFDIYELMEELFKLSLEQRKGMTELKHAQSEAQIDTMKKSAEEQMKAATARMWSGIVSGVVSIGAGAISGAGALGQSGMFGKLFDKMGINSTDSKSFFKALPEEFQKKTILLTPEFNMKMTESLSKVFEGLGKMGTSGIDMAGAQNEDRAKHLEIETKKIEEQVGETKDTLDAIREMNAKVREIMQSIAQSESDSMKTIARM